MEKNYSKLLWGLVVLAVGVIFTGNVLELWYIDVFFPGWWTMFMIIPGLVLILRDGFNVGSVILLVIGVILLCDSWDIFDTRLVWRLIIPIGIIAIGISLIFSFFKGENTKEKVTVEYTEGNYEANNGHKYSKNLKYDNDEYANYSTVFGSSEFKNSSQNLKYVKIEGVFGGVVVDLRDAKFNEDVTLEINTVFAGIDIYVPDDVRIITVSSTPIFGGFSFRKNKEIENIPKVKVKYVAIFGGIEIK